MAAAAPVLYPLRGYIFNLQPLCFPQSNLSCKMQGLSIPKVYALLVSAWVPALSPDFRTKHV